MLQISAENEAAVQDLLIAFGDETNAQARYLAFAAKADKEGLHGAASLFRAAARAEHIHAASHAWVMKQFGEVAWCKIDEFQVKSTLENLKAALAGEQFEIDSLYPGCLEELKARHNAAATRTFMHALEAEKTHAQLFGQAVALLESGNADPRLASARDYYVCPACGYTAESLEESEICTVCRGAADRFETVR